MSSIKNIVIALVAAVAALFAASSLSVSQLKLPGGVTPPALVFFDPSGQPAALQIDPALVSKNNAGVWTLNTAALVGPAGPAGSAGALGPQGPAGPPGPAGSGANITEVNFFPAPGTISLTIPGPADYKQILVFRNGMALTAAREDGTVWDYSVSGSTINLVAAQAASFGDCYKLLIIK